jgi:hypothetical protein
VGEVHGLTTLRLQTGDVSILKTSPANGHISTHVPHFTLAPARSYQSEPGTTTRKSRHAAKLDFYDELLRLFAGCCVAISGGQKAISTLDDG